MTSTDTEAFGLVLLMLCMKGRHVEGKPCRGKLMQRSGDMVCSTGKLAQHAQCFCQSSHTRAMCDWCLLKKDYL